MAEMVENHFTNDRGEANLLYDPFFLGSWKSFPRNGSKILFKGFPITVGKYVVLFNQTTHNFALQFLFDGGITIELFQNQKLYRDIRQSERVQHAANYWPQIEAAIFKLLELNSFPCGATALSLPDYGEPLCSQTSKPLNGIAQLVPRLWNVLPFGFINVQDYRNILRSAQDWKSTKQGRYIPLYFDEEYKFLLYFVKADKSDTNRNTVMIFPPSFKVE